MKRTVLLMALGSMWLTTGGLAQTSEVPGSINYQGRVKDAAGALIGDPDAVNRAVIFRIYDGPTGGALLYAEQQVVTIARGEFSVLVGEGSPVGAEPKPAAGIGAVFDGKQRFLGITVDDGTAAVDAEITPRQQIVSTAFAFRSRVAEGVADGAIVTAMLKPESVTSVVIKEKTIVGADVADGTINSLNIGDGQVGTADLGANAVTSAKIADATITGEDLAQGSVGSGQLVDGGVGLADLPTGSVDLNKLVAAVKNALCPPGSIMPFGGTVAPPGWALCNGGALRPDFEPDLYAVIGDSFGSGVSSNKPYFRLPDLRGVFLRGRDGGAERDPNRFARGALHVGGNTGDNVGSYQLDEFKSHSHRWRGSTGKNSPKEVDFSAFEFGEKNQWEDTESTGGDETRPKNISVNYIIKL